MSDIDQIAAEACEQFWQDHVKDNRQLRQSLNPDNLQSAFKAAIEKAYQQGYVDREKDLRVVKDAVSRAAQESEDTRRLDWLEQHEAKWNDLDALMRFTNIRACIDRGMREESRAAQAGEEPK